MEETKNLKLKKPLDADAPDLPLYVGDNMEVLDGAIGKPAAGTYTSASKSNAENIAALDTETTALVKTVGTPVGGNYTSASKSNAENIAALDTRAKSNADAASSAASSASGANSVATKGLSNQAQIETAGKATNAHTAGEFVIIDNALYKIKSDVAAGDAWTVGSNIESTTLGSELAALNNNLTKQNNILEAKANNTDISIATNENSIWDAKGGTTYVIKGKDGSRFAFLRIYGSEGNALGLYTLDWKEIWTVKRN